MAAVAPAHGTHEPVPSFTKSVGATSASTIVAVPSSAPATSTGSRWRSAASSAAMPTRIPMKASTAIGTFTSSRTCHGAIASTKPPTVGPIASPTRPTVVMRVIARTRRSSSANSRKASAIAPGVVSAAATPIATRTAMSCSAVETKAVARLATPSRTSPMSMTRRRPDRSASAPNASINPPNTTAYAPVTHCNAVVEACSSRPMVGSATFKIELSSISNRKTAESPAKATHASRNDRGMPGDGTATSSRIENSPHVVIPIILLVYCTSRYTGTVYERLYWYGVRLSSWSMRGVAMARHVERGGGANPAEGRSRDDRQGQRRADLPSEPAGRAPRDQRRPLDRAMVVRAAIEVADKEGPEAISMRRIAARLGVGTMSLYWHVASKEELLDLVADALIGEESLPERPSGDWCADLRLLARQMRALMHRHPWLAALLHATSRPGPNALAHAEFSLATVAGLGLDAATSFSIPNAVDDYVRGAVLGELEWAAHKRRIAGGAGEGATIRHAYRQHAEAGGRYPELLRFVNDDDVAIDADANFAFGLDCLLAGIAARIAARRE
jgi:AcrR family transcriptional regulator